MNVLPANISRISNMLRTQTAVNGLQRTNMALFEVQQQMSTNRSINRASDDPVRAAAISLLDQRLNQTEQRSRNLQHADTVLSTLDQAMSQVGELVRSAQSLASGQIGITSDAVTRRQQAGTVDSMLQSLFEITNREVSGVHVFAGSTTTQVPMERFGGGYRYVARGPGMTTDLGSGDTIPLTLGGNNGIGETAGQMLGIRDLDPTVTASTRLSDLRGAQGTGIGTGSVSMSFNGGPSMTVDLTGAGTVQDVMNRLDGALRQYEIDNSVSIVGATGLTVSGGSINVDIAGTGQLVFTNVGGSSVGTDLGLTQNPLDSTSGQTAGLDPKLTMTTPVSALTGVTLPMDSIRVKMSQGSIVSQRTIDLSGATTVDDIRAAIEDSGLGVRVQINEAGTGINVLSEVSGMQMSIEEVAGGSNTATELGIRTMTGDTAVSRLNNGKGVRIVTGATDPVTGLPDPARDVDFQITLGSGQKFNVDLRPQDMTSVQTILDRINSEFATAVGQTPLVATAPALNAGEFTAQLTDSANGLAFVQTLTGTAIRVEKMNNSAAAEDLGLSGAVYDSATSTLQAQDRATVRVNNLFSDLMDLRQALLADDTSGITVAGEQLRATDDIVSATHAMVGSAGRRVEDATAQLEDRKLIDTRTKSEMQDLDFTEAATRFTLLQTQLDASLRVTGQVNGRSLFDFLSF